MALQEIGARLRLSGASAFSKDARKGADSLDRFGRSARDADRKVGGLERTAKRSRSALGGVGKGLAFGGLGVGVAGLGALSAGLVRGFRDAAELQTMLAKTGAVVKSTGGAAGVSAQHVLDMSDRLESLSTMDQGAILNGENLLLTFTRLRNGVGKGNAIFDQATSTMVDMAAALGSDPQTAAIQLGKALNDPVKGVSALSKVGVSFTAQQKAQIKTLVASGKTMQAQKVILKELNTEFGGAAKAAGSGFEGAMFRAKDALSDLARDTATPLLPGVTSKLEDLATYMNTTGTPAVQRFVRGFQDSTGAGGQLRDDLVGIGNAARDAGTFANDYIVPPLRWMSKHPDAMKGLVEAMALYKIAVWGAAGGQKSLATWMAITNRTPPVAPIPGKVPIVGAGPAALIIGSALAMWQESHDTNKLTSTLDKQVKELRAKGDKQQSLAAAAALGVRPGAKPGEYITNPKINANARDRGVQILQDIPRFKVPAPAPVLGPRLPTAGPRLNPSRHPEEPVRHVTIAPVIHMHGYNGSKADIKKIADGVMQELGDAAARK